MHESIEEFVERMGLMLESEGLPRIAGRLVGFLMIHPESYSLDELAEQLKVSKASISTNARHLEEHRVLERTSNPGDRRDYYRMKPDVWQGMLRTAQNRWDTMRELFTTTAAALPDDLEYARKRLIEAEQVHLLMIDAAERMLERWARMKAEQEEESRRPVQSPNERSPAGASEER